MPSSGRTESTLSNPPKDVPLTDFDAVTLSQMTNQKFVTKEEIWALDSWTSDIDACLETLVKETSATIPSMGTIIEASWYDDLAVFVTLEQHQMPWGEAVMRLKGNIVKRRSHVIARADKVSEELGKLNLAQFNRRTAIITSVIGILP